MTTNPEGKKKLPRTIADVLAMEDQIDQLRAIFRGIREEMQGNSVETVDLSWGTSLMHIDNIRSLARKYAVEASEQIRKETIKRARERLLKKKSN